MMDRTVQLIGLQSSYVATYFGIWLRSMIVMIPALPLECVAQHACGDHSGDGISLLCLPGYEIRCILPWNGSWRYALSRLTCRLTLQGTAVPESRE